MGKEPIKPPLPKEQPKWDPPPLREPNRRDNPLPSFPERQYPPPAHNPPPKREEGGGGDTGNRP